MVAHELREQRTNYTALELMRLAPSAVRLMDEVKRLAEGGRVEDLHTYVASIAEEWEREMDKL